MVESGLSLGDLSLLDLIPQRVFIKNAEQIYIYGNEAFASQFNLETDEIPGARDFDLFPGDLAEKYLANDAPVLEEGRSADIVEEVESGGERTLVRTIKRPIRDTDGSIVGVFGMFWDISAEIRDRDALKAIDSRLGMVLDSLQVGVWHWDSIEASLQFDDVCAGFFGLEDRNRLELYEFLELIHPEDRERIAGEVQEIIPANLEKPRFELNYRVISEEGLVRYLHTRGEHYLNEQDNSVRTTGITFDVRTRGRTEDALQTILRINRQMTDVTLDQLLENGLEEAVRLTDSRIGFFHLVDERNGEISLRKWSQETLKICRTTESELHYSMETAGIWVDCIRQRKAVICNDYATAPGRKGLPDGHFPLIRVLTVPVFLDREIVAVVGVGNKPGEYDEMDADHLRLLGENIWNIISRKQNQVEMVRSRDEALEADKTKDRFLSIIAHDLTGPISNIRILVEQLQQLSDSESSDRETLAAINSLLGRSINNSANLLKDLLDWSNSQSNSISFEPRMMNIHLPIDQAVQNCMGMAASKEIDIEIDGPEDLQARIDNNMVQTIVRNLLMNAIKFTNRGDRVGIRYRKDGDEVVLDVHDAGVGIAESRIESLFDLGGTRSTRGTECEKGTGLGLVLCREFTYRHGGRIDVISQPGEGSTFTVRLPISRVDCETG